MYEGIHVISAEHGKINQMILPGTKEHRRIYEYAAGSVHLMERILNCAQQETLIINVAETLLRTPAINILSTA